MHRTPEEPLGLVRAIEEVSLRMREAVEAQDLRALDEALRERQALIGRLMEFDAGKAIGEAAPSLSSGEIIVSKIKEIVSLGDSLIAAVESLKRSVRERRRQNSVARTALRSYLSSAEEPINTRVQDG